MDQSAAPLVEALALAEHNGVTGFGAPGHAQGRAMPPGLRALVGRGAFRADMASPKGLDDRTESAHAVQRAHETAAALWGADLARYVTGGSTQSLHILLAALARPGDTVLLAGNCHKAEYAAALFMGLVPVVVPAAVDPEWDVEHGVALPALAAALDAHPHAKAVVVVSPTYFGVTSDIAALARLAHARGVPLVVDAAWGGAFGASPRLPANPLAQGADAMVASLHKTLGALAQGSVLLARGGLVDLERLALAFELFATTSPSVAILASLDACRRDHARHGAARWGELADLAEEARLALGRIDGVRVLGRERLDGGAAFDLDPTKLAVDISALGVAGYAADDWLYAAHKLSVGMSDARHLLAVTSTGTRRRDLKRLAAGVRDLARRLRAEPGLLPPAPTDLPRLETLGFALAMPPGEALFAPAEKVPYERAGGRIAAELIAPAPPGIPRLIPGQRITDAHVRFLVANRDAGMFVLDPSDPAERRLRVVA